MDQLDPGTVPFLGNDSVADALDRLDDALGLEALQRVSKRGPADFQRLAEKTFAGQPLFPSAFGYLTGEDVGGLMNQR